MSRPNSHQTNSMVTSVFAFLQDYVAKGPRDQGANEGESVDACRFRVRITLHLAPKLSTVQVLLGCCSHVRQTTTKSGGSNGQSPDGRLLGPDPRVRRSSDGIDADSGREASPLLAFPDAKIARPARKVPPRIRPRPLSTDTKMFDRWVSPCGGTCRRGARSQMLGNVMSSGERAGCG